ncbi:MAG: bifunctional UDP-sugar hydrolase/5'-nucleotidase [Vicinamibacterales bacterium]
MIRAAFAATVLSLALAGCASRSAGPAAAGSVPVDVQILAFNDFHGTLEPAAGSNGRIGSTDAGGVAFLATHLARLEATNPNTVIVTAGDSIGASTLLSGMFHDEPTIEALAAAGVDLSTVGNHEFDEGWAELYRMQVGGCHPADGCQDGTPFAGAGFEFLSANVALDPAAVDPAAMARSGWTPRGTGAQTLFPAYSVREIGGVRIGFIGLVLEGTPDIVSKAGLRGLTFRPEAEAGNEAVAALVAQGVQAIVVLIHEGGRPDSPDRNGCGVAGPIVAIAEGLSDEVDVIVSGHTHRSYICTIANKLVTSAESLGRLVTDIDLQIDRGTGEIISKRATNVIVTRDVAPDAAQEALMAHYRPFYGPLADRSVGTITQPLTRATTPAGESAFGDIVADAFLEAGKGADARVVFAFINPGSLRSDLTGDAGAAGQPRQVRYVQAFDSLPFGNRVIVRSMTGEQIVRLLEQQFDNPEPGSAKILQLSAGFTYAFDPARPAGQRIDRGSIRIGGEPLDPARSYRVVSNDFVFGGGDAFAAATEATDPLDAGADSDVLIDYLMKHSPVAPGPQDRITRR